MLLIRRASTADVVPRHMANLLGCFGDVVTVLVDHRHRSIFAELASPEQAAECVRMLDGKSYMGGALSLSQFAASGFRFPARDNLPEGLEVYHNRRTGEAKPGRASRPTRVLRMAPFSRYMNSALLHLVLSFVQEPENIISAPKSDGRGRGFLVEFAELGQAMEVLAVFQRLTIDDQQVLIEFSDRKLPR